MIYFIQEGKDGRIKLGCSSHPNRRLKSLQPANSKELILLGFLPGDEIREKELQKQFKQYHVRGEFFEPNEKLLEFINNNCQKSEIKNRVYYIDNGLYRICLIEPLELNIEKAMCAQSGEIAHVNRSKAHSGGEKTLDKDIVHQVCGMDWNPRSFLWESPSKDRR